MTLTFLLKYPEVVCASLIGILMIFLGSAQKDESEGFHLPPALAEPAKLVLMIFPESYLQWVTVSLLRANLRSNLSFGDFAGAKLYLLLVTLLLNFVLPPLHVNCGALIVYWLPDLYLAIRVRSRQNDIQRALPQAIDLMVLCVDAGLGLDATLQRIASENTEISSALNDELVILGREILLGVDRERAYSEFYNRTGVDELKTLGSALHQASLLGLSVAKILRAQSQFLRKKQSQNAEEKAMKMPIYMAFPLWFFVMPALMLLVMGPSLIRFYHAMSAGGGGP